MSLMRQVAAEIYSMFAGDVLMTVLAIAFVAIAGALRLLTPIPPEEIGFALFASCVALLLTRVYLYASRSQDQGRGG